MKLMYDQSLRGYLCDFFFIVGFAVAAAAVGIALGYALIWLTVWLAMLPVPL